MVNDKTNINVHRNNGNVVLEKNAQSILDRKDNQFRNYKYSKQYKKAYEQYQEKTSRISRPCDEKGKARAFVDNRKDRRKKKQRSSKNKNTRRYSSLAGKKHCGDVCGCKRSQKVEGHDRLRLQQTRQLMMMMMRVSSHLVLGLPCLRFPGIPPSITSFSIRCSCLTTCPKYLKAASPLIKKNPAT